MWLGLGFSPENMSLSMSLGPFQGHIMSFCLKMQGHTENSRDIPLCPLCCDKPCNMSLKVII